MAKRAVDQLRGQTEEEKKPKNLKHHALGVGGAYLAGQILNIAPIVKPYMNNAMNPDDITKAHDAEQLIHRYNQHAKLKNLRIIHDGSAIPSIYRRGLDWDDLKENSGTTTFNKDPNASHLFIVHTGANVADPYLNKKNHEFTLAHEMGHGTDFLKTLHKQKNKSDRAVIVQNSLKNFGSHAAPVAVTGLNYALSREKVRDKIKKLDRGNEKGLAHKTMNFVDKHHKAVGLVTGTAAAAFKHMPGEAKADLNAYKLMRASGIEHAGRKALAGSAANLSNYLGEAVMRGGIPSMAAASLGHLHDKAQKKLQKKASTTPQDNPHADDFHDKYQGFDDAKTVAKRRLKYQVGGAALGAGATLLGLPALSYGTAHLAKAVGRQKRWDGYGIMYKGRSSNNVDPKEEFRNAIPENKFMAGLGGAFTGMSVGGGVADSIQKKRDNKVIAQRYADRPDLKDIALNSHIDVAEAIKQLGLKKKGTH